jgi:hypothetical protein
MQFFIKTYSGTLVDEVKNMADFGNSKSPTGNGSITLYIQNNGDGTYRFGLGLSLRAGLSLPYSETTHYQAWNELDSQFADGFDLTRLEGLLDIYFNKICFEANEVEAYYEQSNIIGRFTLQNYYYWKTKKFITPLNASEWGLVKTKLPDYHKAEDWLQDFIYQDPSDEYWFMSSKYPNTNESALPDFVADGHHIWYGNSSFMVEPPTDDTEITTGGGIEPVPPEGALPPTKEEQPAGTSGGGTNIFSGFWSLLGAILSLILAVLNLILRGLTFNVTLEAGPSNSSLLTPEMIQGLNFLKTYELPMFSMTIWNFFELVFTSLAIFVIIKIIQKLIKTMNSGG